MSRKPVFNEFLALLEDRILKGAAVKWANEASSALNGEEILAGCLADLTGRKRRDDRKNSSPIATYTMSKSPRRW